MKKLTATPRSVCIIASIGFAFDVDDLLKPPLTEPLRELPA